MEVIIDQIPSSCNKNCSFNFDEDETPQVLKIIPSKGMSNTMITIFGSKFSAEGNGSVEVAIGESLCEVLFVNESVITCMAGAHSAGCYTVRVFVEGKGSSLIEYSATFEYDLTADFISPSMGGIGGGNVVTVSGEGFPTFARDASVRAAGQLADLPWFRYGIGSPVYSDTSCFPSSYAKFGCINNTEFFEDLQQHGTDIAIGRLKSRIHDMYSRTHLQVLIGETPCIIIEATLTMVKCVPMPSSEGFFNVTLTVFNHTYTLKDRYTYYSGLVSPIKRISPDVGPVVGSSSITIAGDSLVDAQVVIGWKPCLVTATNEKHVTCTSPNMKPGIFPVFVSSTNGTSTLGDVSLDNGDFQNETTLPKFPMFRYQLEITGATIREGSLLGGTEVTLMGGFFVLNQTEVMVGGKVSPVLSVTDSSVTFLTPNSSRTHGVNISIHLVDNGETM